MAERFTDKQLMAQREIYEQLRDQVLDEVGTGKDLSVGVNELRDLFGACNTRLSERAQEILRDPAVSVPVNPGIFLRSRFSRERLLGLARSAATFLNAAGVVSE